MEGVTAICDICLNGASQPCEAHCQVVFCAPQQESGASRRPVCPGLMAAKLVGGHIIGCGGGEAKGLCRKIAAIRYLPGAARAWRSSVMARSADFNGDDLVGVICMPGVDYPGLNLHGFCLFRRGVAVGCPPYPEWQ